MAKRGKKHHPARPAPPVRRATLASAEASLEVEVRRGIEAFEHGDYGQAIQAWKQAQRAGAPAGVTRALAEAHFRRGLAAVSEGRRMQDFQEAVQLRGDSAVYWHHAGLAAQRLGQLRRAREAFETAHRLRPGSGRFLLHLVLASLADSAGALDVPALSNETAGRSEVTSRLLALVLMRHNHEPANAATTLAALANAARLTILALAIAQLATGQPESALANLAKVQRSRQSFGDDARQAAAIATILGRLATGELDSALDVLRRLAPPVEPALRNAFAAVARRLTQELVLEERLDQGLLACRQALAARPDHEPTQALLGHLHEVLGTQAASRQDFAAASAHWEAALGIDSDNPRILHNLALAEERLERWAQASDHWEALGRVWKKALRGAARDTHAAGELRNRVAALYRHLATTYETAGDAHSAASSLETALNFDPSQVDSQQRAAELYLENEEYGKAIDLLRRTLSARPDDARVLADLGSAYDLKGDDRQAQAYLERALSIEPTNYAVRATLAGVHHGRGHRLLGGQAVRAAAEFERAVELDAGTAEHYECLGKTHLKLGQLNEAKTVFGVALNLEAESVRARISIGRAYLECGFEQQGANLFRQALRVSRAPRTRLAVGLAYLELGRHDQAREQFHHILKSRDALANAAVGKLLIDAEREAEAIPYLERAASLDPLDARVLLDLAFAVAFGRDDFSRAAAELARAERAAKLSADDQALPEIESARRMLNQLGAAAAQAPSRSRPWAAWT